MATTFLVKAWIGPVGPVGQCGNAEECVFFFASIIRLHYGITVLRMWRARNDRVYLVQVSASFFKTEIIITSAPIVLSVVFQG